MLILIVAGGPDKGRIFELLDDTEVILGREGDKVRLNDPKCSRRHARLAKEGDGWYLYDNDSRHGTHRNHKPITGRTHVNPGDYIQVGSTVLVVGEMPTEHVERLALIGATAESAPASDRAEARKPRHEPKARTGVIVGASLAAAAVLVALNIALHVSSARQTDRIREQLAAQEKAPPPVVDTSKTDKKLETIIAQLDTRVATEAEEQKARDQVIGEILAAVSKKPRDLSPQLDRILDRIDQVPDHGPKLDALAKSIDARPDYSTDLKAMAGAIDAMPDHGEQLTALAQKIDSQPRYDEQLAAMAKRLDAGAPLAPAAMPDDLATQLAALAKLSQQNSATLASLESKLEQGIRTDSDAVMAKIDKTLGQMLEDLKKAAPPTAGDDPVMLALAKSQKQTDALFKEVLGELKKRPTTQTIVASLEAELNNTRGSKTSKKTESLFQDVLAELKKQPSAEELATELAKATRNNGQATTDLLQKIMDKVESTEALSPKLDELQKLVKANKKDHVAPVLADMLATLKQVDQRIPDNTKVLMELASLRQQLPADHGNKLDAALTRLKSTPDAEAFEALTEQVQQLAAAEAESRQAQKLLADVLKVAKAREASDAKLARIEELLAQQPVQTRKALDTALARLEDAMGSTVADKAMAAAIEDIRATVRGEVRAELRAERIASQRERQAIAQSGGTEGPVYQSNGQPIVIVTSQSTPLASTAGSAYASTAGPSTVPLPQKDDGLSDTERAYKQAFESGKPVRLGSNKVNPKTGRFIAGRILDPEAARAAGITDWRNWYLMDDFAERMRLQKDATRFLAKSSDGVKDTIALPASEPIITASPAETID